MLELINIEPPSPATACIIWLHGLGADGNDFAGLAQELALPKNHSIRFVLPHAPVRPVTLNGGYPMRAWFDIVGLDSQSLDQSKAGIEQASDDIDQLVQQQLEQGIAPSSLLLAGFSQGGSLALYYGLRMTDCAGVIALSTYLPEMAIPASQQHSPPIFMGHGTFDAVIPRDLGEHTYQLLQTKHYQVNWHEYPMDHAVCADEIKDLRQFICERLL